MVCSSVCGGGRGDDRAKVFGGVRDGTDYVTVFDMGGLGGVAADRE